MALWDVSPKKKAGEPISRAHCKYQGFGGKKMRISVIGILRNMMGGWGLPVCPRGLPSL